jgi:hypothetical protein
MRQACGLQLLFAALVGWLAVPVCAQPLPGTPLGNAFGTIDLFQGIAILPGPVTTGDAAVLEAPNGGQSAGNWSDVVRFFNFQDPTSGRSLSIAYLMSDAENGMASLQVVNGLTGGEILPNQLATNRTFLQEVLTGTGSDDADVTLYTPLPGTGTVYRIHSDAVTSELPEPIVAVPGAPLPGPGPNPPPKPHVFLSLSEQGESTVLHSPLGLLAGLQPRVTADGGDTISFSPNLMIGGTDITIASDAAEGSPEEIEPIPALKGDESESVGYIYSLDPIPEPETYALMLCGLGVVAAAVRGKRRRGS